MMKKIYAMVLRSILRNADRLEMTGKQRSHVLSLIQKVEGVYGI